VWQDLFDSLKAENFTIVAVAEESGGAEAARPWIEQANPAYPCLIDVDHRVAALYGMVNVPQCVWIDEAGHIVRPPETAGSTDHFRRMDPVTRTLAPEDLAARAATRTAYLNAVQDWVRTGRHTMDAGQTQRRLPRITRDMAFADANFRLGIWLRRNGRPDEAPDFWPRPAACIRSPGTSGGRRRTRTRPVWRQGQNSGIACGPLATGLITLHRTCRGSDCPAPAGQLIGQENRIVPSRRPASTTSMPPERIIYSSRWSRYSRTFAPDRKASTVAGMRAAAAAYSAKVVMIEGRSSRRCYQAASVPPGAGPMPFRTDR
jgi:AhpC/TSA family